MKNLKVIVRKNKDNNRYTAYGYLKMCTGKNGMIWFEGLTFSEAINSLLEY